MIIIPAVDIKDGKCVQLVQGKPGSEQVIIDNPAKVAKKWQQLGAKRLHIVDLDGALGSGENIHIVEEIVESIDIPTQMGGGIRSIADAEKLLEAGITTVIIGTMAIDNPDTIEELSTKYGSERICVSLDSKDNKVLTHGWTKTTDKTPLEYAQEFQQKGAGLILYTNVDVEGLQNGINLQPVKDLIENTSIPVIYSGGITSTNDLEILSGINTPYVVIGSALYTKKLDFKQALKYQG
ncbi:MAG: 1-(5-phosphoribosyl)-5-[(5-phosphoribosylamino)methylideneamino]imidazole-4-carboxamide isomerase [Methanosphaera sp. rholeuAM74]|nr:MAG: 1-(5-phosphoribosyl)-5-[(5-phosphoribosylamino)methylideneamino]imidazole-4-carboxamide isomerase [Methanosphaera sp. rholeuAM74]